MISITERMQSRQFVHTKPWARCFKITKRDASILRMTDHDAELQVDEDDDGSLSTYSPSNAPSMESRRKIEGLREESDSFQGFVVTTGDVSIDEIRAGFYHRAQVDIYTVDWRYPWAGWFEHSRLWMHDIVYSGEAWSANLRSISGQLDTRIGRIYNKRCDAVLYDARCSESSGGANQTTGQVTAIVEQRSIIETDVTGQGDDWAKDGFLEWTSGDNFIFNMSVYDVKKNLDASGRIELWLPTPYDVQVGDAFQLRAGCGKAFHADCRKTFSNGDNHRGWPHMPTVKKTLKTPKAQS